MPEWLLTLLVGGVIVGLIGVIYKQLLTKSDHAEICRETQQSLIRSRKEDMEQMFRLHRAWLEDRFESLNDKIENTVMKELKKLNGRS